LSFSINKWVCSGKVFSITEYNCWHFLRDVWRDATGHDLGDRVPASVKAYRDRFDVGAREEQTRIDSPVTPCIAYFPKARKATPHIGMYWRGKVLHLDHSGVVFERIDTMTARMGAVEYYV
jgi:hypothetical protein